jgi:hypothetical protein
MELLDVTAETEATFLRCLHDEAPDNPRITDLRRRWLRANADKGLRARVLKADGGEVVALCQYMPVEGTHIVGRDLLAILCIWVHGYEHMGYARADKSGMSVLVWKPFRDGIETPRFLRQARPLPAPPDKVAVAAFLNGWCCGICGETLTAREAVEGLSDAVDYLEVDTSDRAVMLSWGISAGVFLEGTPYRPYEPPFTSEMLRRDILEIAATKLTDKDGSRRPR